MDRERILIADDNRAMLITMESFLKGYGYEVFPALSSQRALEQIGRDDFDLVIMDIRILETDGMGVLDKIRGINAKLPVIITIGHYITQEVIEVLNRGGL